MNNKIYPGFAEAVADIPDGASVMMSWWGIGSCPLNLIMALRDHGAKQLTYISQNTGGTRIVKALPNKPEIAKYLEAMPYILLKNRQVKKIIVTWGAGTQDNPVEKMILSGELEAEIVPLGTLAERIRAGGSGIEAFYTRTGVGTFYEKGKETKVINGKKCILETALRADYGFVRACKADRMGNLVYRLSSRSINPLIAKACDTTIAEVDEIVETGELHPEHIITPGFYIDRIVQIPREEFK